MTYEMFQEPFEEVLLHYEVDKAYEILDAFTKVYPAIEFIDKVLLQSMINIGEKWESGEAALSQVYMSSRLCERMTETILPKSTAIFKASPPMAIAVLADHHVLGKKIVKSVINASGYNLIDLGYGLSVEDILRHVVSHQIQILIISVLMYPSALEIKKLTAELRRLQLPVKVLVGGAPFMMDPSLWQEVGADAMGRHAADDVPIIEAWIGEGVDHDKL